MVSVILSPLQSVYTPYFNCIWFDFMKAFHANGFSIFPLIFNFIKRFFDTKKSDAVSVDRIGENAVCVTRYPVRGSKGLWIFYPLQLSSQSLTKLLQVLIVPKIHDLFL